MMSAFLCQICCPYSILHFTISLKICLQFTNFLGSIKSCYNENSTSVLCQIGVIGSENESICSNVGYGSKQGSRVFTSELSPNQSGYHKLLKVISLFVLNHLGNYFYKLFKFYFFLFPFLADSLFLQQIIGC